MNIFLRIANGLKKRGALGSIQLLHEITSIGFGRAFDWVFDIKYGTKTFRWTELDAMHDVRSENHARGIRYEPTHQRPFHNLMRQLQFPPDSVFVDIGCGKGRALILAAECGFSRVVGIDFSPSLCDAARDNLGIFQQKTDSEITFEVHALDATEYSFADADNVIYFYNPFDATVLDKVLDQLEVSLKSAPRTIWLIYHNPLWRDVIAARDAYTPTLHQKNGGYEFLVFERTV